MVLAVVVKVLVSVEDIVEDAVDESVDDIVVVKVVVSVDVWVVGQIGAVKLRRLLLYWLAGEAHRVSFGFSSALQTVARRGPTTKSSSQQQSKGLAHKESAPTDLNMKGTI